MDYPGATWKDMYLTQLTTNRVLMIMHDREGSKMNHRLRIIAEGMVNNPSGIKMGQLQEIDWFTPRHRHISEVGGVFASGHGYKCGIWTQDRNVSIQHQIAPSPSTYARHLSTDLPCAPPMS